MHCLHIHTPITTCATNKSATLQRPHPPKEPHRASYLHSAHARLPHLRPPDPLQRPLLPSVNVYPPAPPPDHHHRAPQQLPEHTAHGISSPRFYGSAHSSPWRPLGPDNRYLHPLLLSVVYSPPRFAAALRPYARPATRVRQRIGPWLRPSS